MGRRRKSGRELGVGRMGEFMPAITPEIRFTGDVQSSTDQSKDAHIMTS